MSSVILKLSSQLEGFSLVLTFTCECGNQVGFFSDGELDDHGREWLEAEDDDRIKLISGEKGVLIRCAFCGHMYRLDV
jgi:RNase P subunit RPR2